MGKFGVIVAVLAGLAAPVLLSAAPGNPLAELRREEVKFQGMYDQLNTWHCLGGGGSGSTVVSNAQGPSNSDSLLDTLNARRAQAYRQRGRPVPSPFYYSCDGEK